MSGTSAVNAQYSDTTIFTNENEHITNQWKVLSYKSTYMIYPTSRNKLCDK